MAVTTGGLALDNTANPVRTANVTCSCISSNVDGNQQPALFICSDICIEKAKKRRRQRRAEFG